MIWILSVCGESAESLGFLSALLGSTTCHFSSRVSFHILCWMLANIFSVASV
jgi:hypothetical protein